MLIHPLFHSLNLITVVKSYSKLDRRNSLTGAWDMGNPELEMGCMDMTMVGVQFFEDCDYQFSTSILSSACFIFPFCSARGGILFVR